MPRRSASTSACCSSTSATCLGPVGNWLWPARKGHEPGLERGPIHFSRRVESARTIRHKNEPFGLWRSSWATGTVRHRCNAGPRGGNGVSATESVVAPPKAVVDLMETDDAKALLEVGRVHGHLSADEIAVALDELDLEPAQIDDFYHALEELQIEAVAGAVADKARTIRMPVHVVEKLNKIVRSERKLRAELGREPASAEIGRDL